MTLEFTESNRHLSEFEITAAVLMKIAELQHESLQCDINLPMLHRKLLRPPLQQTIYPGAADSQIPPRLPFVMHHHTKAHITVFYLQHSVFLAACGTQ